MTVLVQNSYLLPDKLVPCPLILKKIQFWYPVCTKLFVIVTGVCRFQANCSACIPSSPYVCTLKRTAQNVKWALRRGEYAFIKITADFSYKNVLIKLLTYHQLFRAI